jgi:ribonuclease R
MVRAKGYRPRTVEQIAQALGVGHVEQEGFHAECRALMRTGRVVLGADDTLLPPGGAGTIIGTYRGHARGFGFVVPEEPLEHGDLYIPAGAALDAMTGDKVVAVARRRAKRRTDGGRLLEGRVTAVLQRGRNRFVGELQRQGRNWHVVPDGHALTAPIAVADRTAKDARAGDQVVVELLQYPSPGREAKGVLVRVLGPRGDPGVETRGIIEQYGFTEEFSEGALREARDAAQGFDFVEAAEGREDLRHETVITIDPAEARDFDDALSLKCHDNGTWELGVHIADVAHFVRPGGALDAEARERANSVYLPRHVIPMLPEVLSNGVCSLQERQPRLAKSVFLSFDADGEVVETRFAETLIRSCKRLTYERAGAVLEGKRGRLSAKVVTLLQEAEKLARAIRGRRLRDGMLVLDLPEVELVFDDSAVVDVRPADVSFSHTLIEMFMVEANEAVARLFAGLRLPCLRRIHDARADLTDGALHRFLRVLGHSLPRKPNRHDLQRLLDKTRGGPEAFAVHLSVLRSMKQADYSPAMMGHFALASEHYAHFTSPIRRYPDLTIHRLLERYLRGGLAGRPHPEDVPSEKELAALGAHCSGRERRAEAAERELRLVFTLRLLEKCLGDEADGIVTGVAGMGLYVQLEKYRVDGLLRFDRLHDDWWRVDASRGAVVGERSGKRITVGDRLRVILSSVHLPMRQLELSLARPAERGNSAKVAKAGARKETHRRTRRSIRASLRGARGHYRK